MGWRGRLVFRLPRLPVGVIQLLLLETKRNNQVTLHLWLRTAQPAELRGISDGAVKKKEGLAMENHGYGGGLVLTWPHGNGC